MQAKIVQLVDKQWFVTMVDEADLIPAIEIRGGQYDGQSKNFAAVLAKNPQAAVPREMLWDQPKFKGYAGPMYDKDDAGNDCLRYEDWGVYAAMSN